MRVVLAAMSTIPESFIDSLTFHRGTVRLPHSTTGIPWAQLLAERKADGFYLHQISHSEDAVLAYTEIAYSPTPRLATIQWANEAWFRLTLEQQGDDPESWSDSVPKV
jgi:hypothetical protein